MRPDWKTWRHAIDHRNRWLQGIPIYDSLPDGWHVIPGTLTEPRGTCWIANGTPFQCRREGRPYKHALMWL